MRTVCRDIHFELGEVVATKDPTLEHLARIPLFADRAKKELQRLRSSCDELDVPAGKFLRSRVRSDTSAS